MNIPKDYTIIGIDGGGTKTHGVLYTDGQIKSEMKAGTTRIGAVGVGESSERTLNMIVELCNKAQIETSELDAVVVGVAGVWLEEEKKRSAQLIKTLARGQGIKFSDLMVTSDAEIALEGALAGGNGIMVIVGTGSIALSKFDKNKLNRCGGWGIELDDEGSGAWIGREGLTAVVRALDGRGKSTMLTDKIVKLYPSIDIKIPRTIVKAYAERVFEYQNLTPYLMECAEQGDEVSLEIIQRSARHLLELPTTLMKDFKENKVNVALMGGIIDADTLLKKMLEKEIESVDKLNLKKPLGSAIDGAIMLAMKMIEQDL